MYHLQNINTKGKFALHTHGNLDLILTNVVGNIY